MKNMKLELDPDQAAVVSQALQLLHMNARGLVEEDICSPATTRQAKKDLEIIEDVNRKMANSWF